MMSKTNSNNKKTGHWGEEVAKRYLIEKGLLIVDQNYRTPYGEIDLIAIDNEELVFVEVKTRSNNAFGYPEDAITDLKEVHLIDSAEYYLQKYEDVSKPWRIDVIGIEGKSDDMSPKIRWYKNAIN